MYIYGICICVGIAIGKHTSTCLSIRLCIGVCRRISMGIGLDMRIGIRCGVWVYGII